jgi:hypothetical protein
MSLGVGGVALGVTEKGHRRHLGLRADPVRIIGKETTLPSEEIPGKPAERVTGTEFAAIPLDVGGTVTHQFDFKHPGKEPEISLAIVGLILTGRTKEAQRLSEELETGPKKGQGLGGLEKEVAKQSSVEIFLSVAWPPGSTGPSARNHSALYQSIETRDFLAFEEANDPSLFGPGLEWLGDVTALDHQVLTLASFRKGGEAELEEARLVVQVNESWLEPATPGTPGGVPTLFAGGGRIEATESTGGLVRVGHGDARTAS